MTMVGGLYFPKTFCCRSLIHGLKPHLRFVPILTEIQSFITFDAKWTHSRKRQVRFEFNGNYKKFKMSEQQISKKGKKLLADIKDARAVVKQRVEAIVERENIWTIPNILCLSRITLSPYLGYLICNENFHPALYLLLFAGLTDLLDGLIARNFSSQSSKLGSFLDPMADKILVATMFITLTYSNIIPVPLTVLIVFRDILLASAGFYIRYKSLPPPKTLARYFDVSHATARLAPTTLSKFNTTVQLIAVGVGLMSPVFEFMNHPVLFYLWCFTGVSTILSGASYIIQKDTYEILKKSKKI